jgi:aspartyl-tRNA(Asn)/glutamyl-tRNA(Gln) amidotransferase subunit B
MDAPDKKSKLIKGATGDWEVVIGLEVHAQVTSEAKLFSGASTAFGGEPNSHVSLVDAAMPGMLPVINEECVRQAVRTGLGLKAKINLKSVFDRKNYFYPDLPQGYQISQYKSPIVGEGEVLVDMPDGETVRVGIERLHLEQDAGKSLHDQNPSMSLVDLNRAGVALMEIVSKPDLRSADEAKAYVAKLRAILRYLGTCDGDMEKGSLRADVNVSVRKPGAPYNTRCEIKNVNSIRFIGQAVEHEARRQIEIIEDGGTIEQETRLFDPDKGETRSMRSKEEAHDYRYFPDPDLLPLELEPSLVEDLRENLPELPDEKKSRFMRDYGMSEFNAAVLVSDKDAADFFEATLAQLADKAKAIGGPRVAGEVSKWVQGELFAALNKQGVEIINSPVSPVQAASLLRLRLDGEINSTIAREVFEIVWNEGGDPREIVEKRGLRQVTDSSAIEKIVDEIIANNPEKVEDVRANPRGITWFVGQVMKESQGKADARLANELLKKRLFDIKLFAEGTRSRQEPLKRGEQLFQFYDECGRSGYDEFRALLNTWLSEIKSDEHRMELISRAQNGGNTAFKGVLCELLVHALLVRLGYTISIHPDVPGSKRHPDFALVDEGKRILCYVEVTTINRADDEESHLNREAAIYNAINSSNLPPGCLLGYNLIKAGRDAPPLRPLVVSIERWASENERRARSEDVVRSFNAGGWTIEIELYSGGEAGSGAAAIGVAAMPGGRITPAENVRTALERKSRRYGKLDAPYMIVVADTKGEIFRENAVRDAVVEAIYGDPMVSVAAGREPREVQANNGFWFAAGGCRNQHVGAILLLPDAGIWKLREARWQPLLAVNLCANLQTPDNINRLEHLEAEQTEWVRREGKSVADILGLPTPWPPTE